MDFRSALLNKIRNSYLCLEESIIDTYWNHNTVFHDELVADAKIRGGRVLEVGCGDGLLIERLAPYAEHVVGIDLDSKIIQRAQTRLAGMSNVSLINEDFLKMPTPPLENRFDTVICVATLHHMELKAALLKISEMLKPNGRLLIIGLAADKTIKDILISGLLLFPIRLMDRFHGGMKGPGFRIAEPQESLSEIREVARALLPGVKLRRRFYYRYSLTWTKL